jgi:hypothetical protein
MIFCFVPLAGTKRHKMIGIFVVMIKVIFKSCYRHHSILRQNHTLLSANIILCTDTI